MERIKKLTVVAVFALIIFGFALWLLLAPDKSFSDSERRALAAAPELRWSAVKSGDYFEDAETYLLDQFPLRDGFRSLKAVTNHSVLHRKDVGGYYSADGHLAQLTGDLDEKQVQLAIDKFNQIIAAHPELDSAYYAVIPDKNYFLAEANGYPVMDYAALFAQMEGVMAEQIDITGLLSLEDYYTTDSHWRQERILPVAQALCGAMGAEAATDYTRHDIFGFYGVYAGHTAIPTQPDTLSYLSSAATEAALVQSYEHSAPMAVYTVEEFEGVDPYDVYLSGAEALITIENPLAENDRHLILFRDSFGSSLAPLLVDSYAQITLIDLRYVNSSMLDTLVDFTGADVLFLYSTTLLNTGSILK